MPEFIKRNYLIDQMDQIQDEKRAFRNGRLFFVSEKNKTNFPRLYYKNETSYRITGKVFIIYSKQIPGWRTWQ
jgi:hypothetical protein